MNLTTQPVIYLATSGDGRESANVASWPAQQLLEQRIATALSTLGAQVVRAFEPAKDAQHGFINGQRMGIDVFNRIPAGAPVIVAIAGWQFSHHVLAGLRSHEGPILTAGNWSGEWPGLVGLLNLNGSLTKAGIAYSTIWSEDYTDAFATEALREWVATQHVSHDASHVRNFTPASVPNEASALGKRLAKQFQRDKAIIGIFDEGCMGMYNAVIDDEHLNALGIYKERLSQAALLAEMRLVTDDEAASVRTWLDDSGLKFVTGSDPSSSLTNDQILDQARMYVAALRIADRFNCDAIGIQYQNGLTDMAPASDLVEGLLNNPIRPPALHRETRRELYAGQALPHFNEVDEGAAVDALVTNRVWSALDFEPSTTLHDLRWGESYEVNGRDEFIWVLMISGAAPASHFEGGYGAAKSHRQPAVFFPRGGGTLTGVSKAGEVVWSRVYLQDGALHADIGLGEAVSLPESETERRWSLTTPEWPIMHLKLRGVSRDQMMARHKANHIQVAYAPDLEAAQSALAAKAATFHELGITVHLCGETGLA